jgi:dihydrofolate synthase/folylpolyglutamate synthase
LAGHYQQKNLQTVLASIDQLVNMGWAIETKAIHAGLANCCLLTGFAGRWTVLQEKPLTIADTAHNLPGIELLLKQLNQLKYEQMHFVISMVKDKDIDKILSILPKNAIYYFSKAGIPRGLDAAILAQQAAPYQLKGAVYNSVALAFEAAKTAAEENDLIFIGGSTFTVAEII